MESSDVLLLFGNKEAILGFNKTVVNKTPFCGIKNASGYRRSWPSTIFYLVCLLSVLPPL